jgi:hypothetical protein
MAHFVRFIFTIVAAGIVVSLALVMFSDFRGRTRQRRAEAEERRLFEKLIEHNNGRLCRGNIAVEWQKTSAIGEVLQTSVLVRRYAIDAEDKQSPLPIKRIILPGARVCVDGLVIKFDALFNEEFKNVRSVRLAYFARVYSEQQPSLERFSFLQEWQVPDATLVHRDHVTHYEERLWQYLWDLIPSTERVEKQGQIDRAEMQRLLDRAAKQGLTVDWKEPACRVVKNGLVYAIFVGDEGATFDTSDDPSLLNDMLREVQQQDQEHTATPADSTPPVMR